MYGCADQERGAGAGRHGHEADADTSVEHCDNISVLDHDTSQRRQCPELGSQYVAITSRNTSFVIHSFVFSVERAAAVDGVQSPRAAWFVFI